MKPTRPSARDLAATLGDAQARWDALLATLRGEYEPLDEEWKPSKADFGRMCLLKHKKRTLLYLTPGREEIVAAIVLGERAVGLALAGGLPEHIKTLIREARSYAEGRGIRFPVRHFADVTVVGDLVAIKTTPK